MDYELYLSKHRNEKIVNVKKAEILYPNERVELQKAVDSILQKYGNSKHTFLAAGVLLGNEENKEANLFNTVFGRDSLIMLDFLRMIEDKNNFNPDSKKVDFPPNLEHDILYFLAQYQGQKSNPNSEEEFGKILHEYRPKDDPIALELLKEKGWEFPYFGAIDSTFYFIKLLSDLIIKHHSFKDEKVINLLSNIEYTILDCLNNAVEYSKTLIRDGLVYYKRTNNMGIEIQSWRDSYDSVSSKNGLLPDYTKSICLLDIQLIAIESYKSISKLYLYLGEIEKYTKISELYNKLIVSLDKNLWVNDGFYAMGLQEQNGIKLVFDVVSSSNLNLLNLDFIDASKKEKIFEYCYPKLKVDNGIATLSKEEVRYHASGYHTGNVWIFDNVYSVLGLISIGKINECKEIEKNIDSIVNTTNCFPELVGSYDLPNKFIIDVKDEHDDTTNRVSQAGQPLQGWSILSYIALKTLMH
jgi:glycogen debranching enzyme